MPTLSDSVLVDYRAFLLDGSEFDSPDEEPGEAVFAMDEVIPGWKEALLRMEEGSQWELYIPANLAHKGSTRKRGMLGFEPLVYVLELKSIFDADVPAQDQ
jgi:FKBP-type peptidyl-prolyl cis-trans isomerase